jgi:hypothetical protein
VKNIASALVKAQKAFGPALKSSTNPHFKSKYADLAACVEAVIDGLNTNGIYLAQVCHESESGVTVETKLIHESGEEFSAGKLHVPASKQDPQGYGSALTYARRYSLMAACGIAPEDDDGNSAARKADATPVPNRTMTMKVINAIREHIVQGRSLGALQEWELACEDQDFAKGVWSGLTSPEQDEIRRLRGKAEKDPV